MNRPSVISPSTRPLLDEYRALHNRWSELMQIKYGDPVRQIDDDMMICFALNDACRALADRLERSRELMRQDEQSLELDRAEKPEESAVPTMVTLKEAAARTGMSYDFLRKGCLSGQFAHVRCGSKILINFDELIKTLNTAGKAVGK